MKHANMTAVHKKGSPLDQSNYHHVSILPNLSKALERCLLKQISNFFENIFSNFRMLLGRVVIQHIAY